jgi:CBS domain-containing protein
MSDHKVGEYTVPDSATLLDAVDIIAHNHSRCAVTVSGKKVTGVISEGDILRCLLKGADIHAPLVSFINPSFKFLRRRDLDAALDLFREHGISLVPVLDLDFSLLSVVLLSDVLDKVKLSKND